MQIRNGLLTVAFLLLIVSGFCQQYLVNESFEGTAFLPAGWVNGGATLNTDLTYVHAGTKSCCIPQGSYIITPRLTLPGVISFYCRKDTGTGDLYLEYASDSLATSWTPLLTFSPTGSWGQSSGNVAALSIPSNSFFKLRSESTHQTNANYVDDFNINLNPPSVQISNLVTNPGIPVTATSITLTWSAGDGNRRILFLREATAGTPGNPVDGTIYTASSNWANKGSQLGTTGYYCIYSGSGTSVTLTNLTPGTTYYVIAYEYSTGNAYNGVTPVTYKTGGATHNFTTTNAVTLLTTNPATPAANVKVGTVNNLAYTWSLAAAGITGQVCTFSQVNFTTTGTYSASDLTDFKLWYNSSNNLLTAVQLGSTLSASLQAGTHTFSGFNQNITTGSTYYYWITTGISASAATGKTISVSALVTDNLTVSNCTKYATAYAGGTLTTIGLPVITTPTSVSITSITAVLGGNITNINYSSVTTRGIYWSTTPGFADETGTQVAETDTYGTGTFTVPVSGLSPNTVYYYKAFATNAAGTSYTTQSSFTTLYVSHPADYYRTIATGNWSTISLWESSEDNIHWYPATQAPDYMSLGIDIRNPDTITMTAGVTVDNLVIDNGGTLIIPAGVTMTINNGNGTDLVHNGNLTITGSVAFNSGAAASCGTTSYVLYNGSTPQTISGFTQFGSLDITNPAGVTLVNSITVDITLNVGRGCTLNATDLITLTFSPGATANGASNVNGTVIQHTVAIPRTTTYSNIDVGIVVVAGSADIDPFQAIKMDMSYTTPATSIARTWNITGISATNGSITLKWPTSKDNGNTFGNGMCKVWKNSGGSWINYALAVVSMVGNVRSATFSYIFPFTKGNNDFTITEDGGTLPVELSSFTAMVTPQSFVRLDWVTQSETGVLGYNIYRNIIENVNSAKMVSPLISATNTSQEVSYSYTDREIPGDGTYYYWLQNQDINGEYEFHGPIVAIVNVNNNDTPVIPLMTTLCNPYPNPFNPAVTIAYGLAKAEHIQILIYNNKGQKIRTLLDAAKNPGQTRLIWNGTSDNGKALSTGVYYVKMLAGKYTSTQKVVLMK